MKILILLGNNLYIVRKGELNKMNKTASITKAVNRYNKKNTKIVPIRLNYKNDGDILNKLSTVDSMTGYIKKLIREDIARN